MKNLFGAVLAFFGGLLAINQYDKPINDYKDPDVDILARTIWGEARGEGDAGMIAVANVAMNRYQQAKNSVAKARQFGRTIAEICQKPYQFSVWNAKDPNYDQILKVDESNPEFNRALAIARTAVSGQLGDITGGADHYHAEYVNPNWANPLKLTTVIETHKFYNLA